MTRAGAARESDMYATAFALHQQARLPEARALYEQILKDRPDHFGALLLLGLMELQDENPRRALELTARATVLEPHNPDACNYHGSALLESAQGRTDQVEAAIANFDRAIALRPDYADAHYNRGNALLELRRYEDAIASYDRSIARNPAHPLALNNRGIALSDLNRHSEAIDSFNRAIALRCDDAQAYLNRGNALQELAQFQAAVASYDAAIALWPSSAQAHNNRGNALSQLQQWEPALRSYERARQLDPDLKFLPGACWHTRMRLCDWTGFEPATADLAGRIDADQAACLPLTALTVSDSARLHLEAARIFLREECPRAGAPVVFSNRRRHGRIRVGYFSADFRIHPVSLLLAEMIELFDRSRFEVIAYSFGPDTQDEMRRRLQHSFDRFLDVRDRSAADIALLARDMELDIAVDLGGFTTGARPGIFSQRAAPIQAGFLGYPATTAAPYMDYLFADVTTVPEAMRPFYSERIVYLPHSFMVHDSTRPIAPHTPTRAQAGLPPSGFVFCCFNACYKITPGIFDAWMQILKRVSGSVLWLSGDNATAANHLRRSAASRGVAAERLVFAPKLPSQSEHLRRISLADLFLDTLPYNAHATAADALWVGLPILTCAGEAFASRVTASLLSAIGLPELIAPTPCQYEARAIELATDGAELRAIRRKLAANRLTSPLFDTRLFTTHMEMALREMYERHQADQPPADIHVAPVQAAAVTRSAAVRSIDPSPVSR
jgi:predicted O-linked N-acetylglucosamine transferase (SPINDLY family)